VMLAPYTDIVARIWNENTILLKCVEDYSGNWYRGLGRLFNGVETEELKFPHSLGTLYLEKTSFIGTPFAPILGRTRPRSSLDSVNERKQLVGFEEEETNTVLLQGYLEKEGRFRIGMRRRYFRLRPGFLAYYNDEHDKHLKGEFSLFGNFELLPNINTAGSAGASPTAKKPASANTLVDTVMVYTNLLYNTFLFFYAWVYTTQYLLQ
jgi:hypothetical protein